jgi:8-oxo-dGTP pyrophosphatase MutT (NUDIX family)
MLSLRGLPLGGEFIRGRACLLPAERRASQPEIAQDHDQYSARVLIVRNNVGEESIVSSVEQLSRSGECAVVAEESSDALKRLVSKKNLTAVANICADYFLPGDVVKVDGTSGFVEIEEVSAKEVVNCLIQFRGKTLILKRSSMVGSFQGKWASVSGYIEENETPYEAALKEIREEISVDNPVLVRKGNAVVTRKEGTVWISHPFLFSLESQDIRIDWEHTDYRWIDIDELSNYDTVPGLKALISSLGL